MRGIIIRLIKAFHIFKTVRPLHLRDSKLAHDPHTATGTSQPSEDEEVTLGHRIVHPRGGEGRRTVHLFSNEPAEFATDVHEELFQQTLAVPLRYRKKNTTKII